MHNKEISFQIKLSIAIFLRLALHEFYFTIHSHIVIKSEKRFFLLIDILHGEFNWLLILLKLMDHKVHDLMHAVHPILVSVHKVRYVHVLW